MPNPLAPRTSREPSEEELKLAALFEQAANDIQNGACSRCVASVVMEELVPFAKFKSHATHPDAHE